MSDSAQSSPSPNTHFRESDVEFLQQQARIWLEAVLDERFDEDTSLADLLADGDIMQRVSSNVRVLLRKHSDGEPASPRSLFPEASFYGKHGGKYLPYSNVDTFLKVCQKLGLSGIDLFSPPDVVEKKDIRRVCLCIRALSKKARDRQLGVPNFDYVTHSITMPTELVGGLRESLTQASSPSKFLETKETQEKARPSSLLHKRWAHMDINDREPAVLSSEFTKERVVECTKKDDNGPKGTMPVSADDRLQSMKCVNQQEWVADRTKGYQNGNLFGDGQLQGPPLETRQGAAFDKTMQSPCKVLSLGNHLSFNPIEEHLKTIVPEDADPRESLEALTSQKLPVCKNDGTDCGEIKKKRSWLPIVAAAIALLGAAFVLRAREPAVYKVQKGDTLSDISRRTGKTNWEELARLNPGIRNPDLIYPSDRLRLRS